MNFSAIVTKHFDFLITLFGYSQEIISGTEVQYQLKEQSIVFAYDSKRSYEVIIFIGEKTDASNAITRT